MLSVNIGVTNNSPSWGSAIRRGSGGVSRMERMQAACAHLDRDLNVHVVVVQEAGHMIEKGSPHAEAALRAVTPAFSWVRTRSFMCGTLRGGKYTVLRVAEISAIVDDNTTGPQLKEECVSVVQW